MLHHAEHFPCAEAAPAPEPQGTERELEGPRPLRDSILWKLQDAYYDRVNIRCWQDQIVPNFVTSNAFIAQQYARVILGFIRDWHSQG